MEKIEAGVDLRELGFGVHGGDIDWVGTFEEITDGDSPEAESVRSQFWDIYRDAEDDDGEPWTTPIPGRILDHFVETLRHPYRRFRPFLAGAGFSNVPAIPRTSHHLACFDSDAASAPPATTAQPINEIAAPALKSSRASFRSERGPVGFMLNWSAW